VDVVYFPIDEHLVLLVPQALNATVLLEKNKQERPALQSESLLHVQHSSPLQDLSFVQEITLKIEITIKNTIVTIDSLVFMFFIVTFFIQFEINKINTNDIN